MSDLPPTQSSQVPPPPPPPVGGSTPTGSGGRAGLWIAFAAVLGLLIGAAVGVAADQPSKHDVAQQRDDALAEAIDLRASLETAQDSASSNSQARDACSRAATDAEDLIAQHENLWSDFSTYMSSPTGSGAEAEIMMHMDSQQQTMVAQRDVVDEELTACRTAVG